MGLATPQQIDLQVWGTLAGPLRQVMGGGQR